MVKTFSHGNHDDDTELMILGTATWTYHEGHKNIGDWAAHVKLERGENGQIQCSFYQIIMVSLVPMSGISRMGLGKSFKSNTYIFVCRTIMSIRESLQRINKKGIDLGCEIEESGLQGLGLRVLLFNQETPFNIFIAHRFGPRFYISGER